MALYGHRPGQDEPDPRPLPEPDAVHGQLGAMVEAFSAMLTGTRLEDDLADLLWSFVNLFHRKVDRIERELDINEQAQRRGQAEQDGSEVKSVELERLIAQGLSLIERRNAFEFVRDHAAELFEVDDRLRLAAARRIHGQSPRAHRLDDRQPRIYRRPPPRRHRGARSRRRPHRLHRRHRLQRSRRASGTRSTRSAPSTPTWCCCMAAARAAPSASPPAGPTIAKFRRSSSSPTGRREGRAAPFKRNDRLLEALPIGVVVFPGSGISANLADKAKKLGIPVWRFTDRRQHRRRRRLGAVFLAGPRQELAACGRLAGQRHDIFA